MLHGCMRSRSLPVEASKASGRYPQTVTPTPQLIVPLQDKGRAGAQLTARSDLTLLQSVRLINLHDPVPQKSPELLVVASRASTCNVEFTHANMLILA